MKRALIFGNNILGQFLLNGLNILDYDAIDVTETEDLSSKFDDRNKPECIIDVTNAIETLDEENILYHNNEGIVELLMYANRYKIPFLFLYKEPANFSKDHSLTFAFESIEKFAKNSSSIAKIQIEDIYGIDINTSRKLSDMLGSILQNESIKVDDDLSEIYLLNQKDFISGLIRCIKEMQQHRGKRLYTLFPETPISEIELTYLVSELTNYEKEIEFLSESIASKNIEIDTETTYPNDWFPNVDLEEGLIELVKFLGIEKVKIHSVQENFHAEFDDQEIADSPKDHEIEESKIHDEEKNDAPTIFENDTAVNSDPLDLYASKVDDIPVTIETGAKYYRPERTETKDSKEKHTDQSEKMKTKAKKVAFALSTLLILATTFPSVQFFYKYNEIVNSTTKITNLIQSRSYKEAEKQTLKNIELIESLESVPFYIKVLSLAIDRTDQKLLDNLAFFEKISQAQKYVSLANLNIYDISSSSNISETTFPPSDVLGIQTEDSQSVYSDKIKELEIDLSSLKFEKTFISNDNLNQSKDYLLKSSYVLTKMKSEELKQLLGFQTAQRLLYFVQDPDELRPTGGKIERFGILTLDHGKFDFNQQASIEELDDQIELNNMSVIEAPKPLKTLLGQTSLKPSDSNWDPNFSKSSAIFSNFYSLVYGDQLFDGVMAISKNSFLKLLNPSLAETEKFDTFIEKLQKGEILIAHKNGALKTWISKNGWDGSLINYSDDYLFVVDTNLGQNQINQNIERKTKLVVSPTEETEYIRDLTISYKNKNSTDGNKNNYIVNLRVYTPKDTMLNSAYLLNSSEKTTITRSVLTETIGKFNVFSVDLQIPAQQSIDVVIQYQSPYKTRSSNDINLIIQKQSGYLNDNIEIQSIYSLGFPIKYPNIFNKLDNSLFYEDMLESDLYLEIPL